MTDSLLNTFAPTYKDTGELDRRFSEDLMIIFKSAGSKVLEGLERFKAEKKKLEYQYGIYGYELAIAFIKRIEEINETEGYKTPSNQFKWRSKRLLKSLRVGLSEIGHQPAIVSTIIGAAQYTVDIEPKHRDYNSDLDGTPEYYAEWKAYELRFYNWCRSLTVSSLYELSRTDNTMGLPFTSLANQELKELSNNFTESISRKKIREIRERYPRDEHKNQGKQLKSFRSLDDDPSPTIEVIETQEDIQRMFFHYLSLIDMDQAFVDDAFQERLSTMSREVELLKSWLPSRNRSHLSKYV